MKTKQMLQQTVGDEMQFRGSAVVLLRDASSTRTPLVNKE
jgi:hypothetical protein